MAALLLDIVRGYVIAGLAVAAVFLTVGIGRVAPDARGAYVFRPLLIPGIALLWPVVALRWLALERGGAHGQAAYLPPRKAQGFVGLAMAGLVVAVVIAVFAMRQQEPVTRAPVLLEAPQTGVVAQ